MPLHGEAIKSCDGQGLKSIKRKDSDHLRKNSLRGRIQWSKICVVRRWCDSPPTGSSTDGSISTDPGEPQTLPVYRIWVQRNRVVAKVRVRERPRNRQLIA